MVGWAAELGRYGQVIEGGQSESVVQSPVYRHQHLSVSRYFHGRCGAADSNAENPDDDGGFLHRRLLQDPGHGGWNDGHFQGCRADLESEVYNLLETKDPRLCVGIRTVGPHFVWEALRVSAAELQRHRRHRGRISSRRNSSVLWV